MPLDTSTYSLALLRLDGRRWNELRRVTAQISTQPSSDGSSYLSMGNTQVLCTVTGPCDPSKLRSIGGGGNSNAGEKAEVRVEISFAGFAGVDRKKYGRNDKRIQELSNTLCTTFTPHLLTTLTSNSTILLSLHILSLDGSLLSALINASTLALIDAGIPMPSYICACTAGSTSSYSSNDEKADPLLDLNLGEEQELPFLTVATAGEGDGDGVVALVMETRVQAGRLEGMLAVGVDGCKQVREILDGVIRSRGKKMLGGAMA
ncbi:073ccc37-bbff-40fc-aab1-8e00df0ad474 [Sclerotinia trifoliorum]|uniref:073ccc37-bbff-40fc-aab1-8e00df0ad474 n=1 Tax=Sclerotinia trifoliorum TaxID=28548 RepID=A0A8H2VPG2_9HELO|nr:073ccc37-bbff-40fc-aab1-8e00df0ad474 [Sclerotinia trifoliorum]